MFDLVQITSQYSNAVLVAILPHVSNFAQKLDVQIHTPITPSQVLEFKCDPRKDHIGGAIVLTNHFEFTYLDGRVCVYRSPDSYFSLQEPERIPAFYGKIKISEKEALKAVHQTIQKLGYNNSMLHADTVPKVTAPEKIGNHYVARYRFRWLDPRWPGPKDSSIVPAIFDVEVNASSGKIEMLSLTSRETIGPNPEIAVEPQLEKNSEEPSSKPRGAPAKAVWVNRDFALAFLDAVLPQVSQFVTNTGLSLPIPIAKSSVDMSRYLCVIDEGSPIAQICLKNGDRFNYGHGIVEAFYSHDAIFKFPDMGRAEDFIGKRNMTTNDAINFTRNVLKKLGYSNEQAQAQSPAYAGTERSTRYFVNFLRVDDNSDVAGFEIDLGTKGIKSIFLHEPSLWRQSPNISVPLTLQTNRPSF